MNDIRTETARDHDDSDIIDRAVEQPDSPTKVGRAGGNLPRDIGTKDEKKRAEDPDAHTRVTKQDDIENDVRYSRDDAHSA